MARSPLVPVQIPRDAGVSWGTGVAASTLGFYVPLYTGPYRLILLITNADASAHTAIIRSGSYNGTPTGAANSSVVPPWNTVYTQGTVGDLTLTVAAGDTQVFKVTTTDRFKQTDGGLYLDFPTTPTSCTVRALVEPYVVA